MSNLIQQTLAQHAKTQADKTAFYLSSSNYQFTYGRLNQLASDYDDFFNQWGIPEQTIIAQALSNGRASLELILGAYASNRVVLPLNMVSGDKNLKYVLAHAEPTLLFASPEHIDRVRKIADENLIIVEVEEEGTVLDCKVTNHFDGLTPLFPGESNALLMYTSGTTGNPKGVLLTDKNMLAGGNNTSIAHQLEKEDIGLCVLPLCHINAQCVSIMSTICQGSSLVLALKFSVNGFLPLIQKYKITWASVVPTMLAFLLNALGNKSIEWDKSMTRSLRFMRSASAPLPVEVHQKIEQWFNIPIIETMGITEAAAQILSNPMPPKERKIGSVGLGFGNEVNICNDKLQPLAAGIEGEICVKGDNVMRSYYKNPEATEKALTEDGWLRTGDLATLDQDGYIFVTGRSKELIIKGGENIAPREIDEVLYLHPAIIEAAAFGAECPNYGQRVEACVKKDENLTVTEEELIALCHEHVGKFKSPTTIHFLDELPKGPSGKIQRLKLYDILYPQKS